MNSTKFALFVTSESFMATPLIDCMRFIKAALQLGHQIDMVFLYQDSVYAALAEPDLPSDEPDLAGQLALLCQANQIALLYCATAAEKRGVQQIRPGYTLAGLAEFGMRLASVDKLVQF